MNKIVLIKLVFCEIVLYKFYTIQYELALTALILIKKVFLKISNNKVILALLYRGIQSKEKSGLLPTHDFQKNSPN